MWKSFDGGSSINQIGSENGIIVKDEEHENGARITIEKNGYIAPFSITCGIYGLFAHTAFCGDEQEADKKYEDMKTDIDFILHNPNSENDYISDWCDKFTNKY
jgi:hypothetical protein